MWIFALVSAAFGFWMAVELYGAVRTANPEGVEGYARAVGVACGSVATVVVALSKLFG